MKAVKDKYIKYVKEFLTNNSENMVIATIKKMDAIRFQAFMLALNEIAKEKDEKD